MRIDDTDPDELDDEPAGKRSRRKWWVLGAAVMAAGAAITVVAITGDDDGSAVAGTTTVGETDTTIEDDEPDKPIVGPAADGYPDYGSDYMGPELDVLFQRVTDTGIRVTVHDNGDWGAWGEGGDVVPFEAPAAAPAVAPAVESTAAAVEPAPGGVIAPPTTVGVGGWVPAAWCSPIGGFRLTMSYKDAIGVAGGSRYTEPRDGIAATLFTSGYAEGVPFRVLVLQLAPDVTQAAVVWDDGATDAAAAVKGWVVLATPGEPSGKFDLTVQTGAGERRIAWDELPREGDIAWQKACNPPPPSLPDAGVQPADPAAAEQQIRDKFDLLWNTDVEFSDKGEQLLDDTTGVQDALDAVMDGGFAEVARTATHTMTELVFTSPTEAWFRYDIQSSTANFIDRYGIAYFIDGEWKFARAVICQDLSLAGGQCMPFVDQIYPPGSNPNGNFPPGVPIPID
ncbi:MAG: hypothetical protein Q7V88_16150 [Actinomycetota bacterium]|nr:hypothetical protein [Actinomycetota bacterium]